MTPVRPLSFTRRPLTLELGGPRSGGRVSEKSHSRLAFEREAAERAISPRAEYGPERFHRGTPQIPRHFDTGVSLVCVLSCCSVRADTSVQALKLKQSSVERPRQFRLNRPVADAMKR